MTPRRRRSSGGPLIKPAVVAAHRIVSQVGRTGTLRDTRSQTVTFVDQGGRTVVRAHEKAGRPNGEPAEGTWADPKYIFERGVRYVHDPMLDLLG